jgi:hypothetical protein
MLTMSLVPTQSGSMRYSSDVEPCYKLIDYQQTEGYPCFTCCKSPGNASASKAKEVKYAIASPKTAETALAAPDVNVSILIKVK